MRSFTAGKNEDGLRLWRFCEKVCPEMPKGLLHKAFRNKRVKINGKKQDEDYRIIIGDLIELYINDEFFTSDENSAGTDKNPTVDYSSLQVVYEDGNILILNKPFGLLCHSDNKNEPNLIDMAVAYLTEKGEYLPDKEVSFTPALCNRIDQGTEGMVIVAKNYTALTEINQLIREDKTEKTYLCVTNKAVPDGRYTAYHKRDLKAKKVTIYANKVNDSKEIITEFRTLQAKNNLSLVECKLITGRTHQIRAHLAYLGCPIIGDKKYGKAYKGLESQLLCAYKLKFGNIDSDMSVAYLSGREFCLEDNSVKRFFAK